MRPDEKIAGLSRNYIYILNQMHEIKKKLLRIPEDHRLAIQKHVTKIEDNLSTNLSLPFIATDNGVSSLFSEDPTGQDYNAVRTDCEADVLAKTTGRLIITETIKPIIKLKVDGQVVILQRGIVIVDNA